MRFLSLTKPGIIFGNIITLCGGYFLGSQYGFKFGLLLIVIVAMAMVVACGCVFNNYIDRDIDCLMERTKNRVLVQGLIPAWVALIYAALLGVFGLVLLYWLVNALTAFVAIIGLFFYVVVYSLWLKRRSIYSTAAGGVAGAIPPVVGYCAVTNRFDTGAVILFAILFFWQLPHSYAIAIFRAKDYALASIPVLPLKKNMHYTKVLMLLCVAAFAVATIMPSLLGYTGVIYLVIALCLAASWLTLAYQGLKRSDDIRWARKMFSTSIFTISLLSFAMLVRV